MTCLFSPSTLGRPANGSIASASRPCGAATSPSQNVRTKESGENRDVRERAPEAKCHGLHNTRMSPFVVIRNRGDSVRSKPEVNAGRNGGGESQIHRSFCRLTPARRSASSSTESRFFIRNRESGFVRPPMAATIPAAARRRCLPWAKINRRERGVLKGFSQIYSVRGCPSV